jgi:hypothetical protein
MEREGNKQVCGWGRTAGFDQETRRFNLLCFQVCINKHASATVLLPGKEQREKPKIVSMILARKTLYQGDKEWVAIQIVSVLSGPVGPEAQLEIQAALQIACPTYHVPTAQLRKYVLYSASLCVFVHGSS